MTAAATETSAPHHSGGRTATPAVVPPEPHSAGIAARALLVLAAAGALIWAVTHVSQREAPAPPEAAITLEGEHYRLAPGELRWLESFSALHFSEGEQAARGIVADEIDARLERVFAHARASLPEFADWYYSLRGEYSRAAMAALSLANLAEPDYVAERAGSMLFPDEVWAGELERLEHATAERLEAQRARVREQWVGEVTQRLAANRVPAPVPGAQAPAGPALALDGLITDVVAREQAALETRLSVSTLAAGGAAVGPALWRAAAARRSAAAGKAVARVARAAGRGGVRAGTAATGGALVCAPGGPVALGCALAAGTATWLGTDWALLRLDEHLHRDELVGALEASLDELRAEVEREMLEAYDTVVANHYEGVRADIRGSFVPARRTVP